MQSIVFCFIVDISNNLILHAIVCIKMNNYSLFVKDEKLIRVVYIVNM